MTSHGLPPSPPPPAARPARPARAAVPGPSIAVALLAACLLAAAPAGAQERPGAGLSLGAGVAAYSPAPTVGPRVHLPALEIALAPGGGPRQLRLRTPLLETVYNAVLREQLYLEIDAMLLLFPGPQGRAARAVIGPLAGVRLNAAPHAVQPGLVLGGRAGGEVRGRRGFALFIGVEPLVELMGGSAGAGRRTATLGGGVSLAVAATWHRVNP